MNNNDNASTNSDANSVTQNSPQDVSDTADMLLNKYIGSLVGLAVGDAVGTAVEFMAPGSFATVTDMTGGGYFKLKAGEWTDDTSMSLCLAASLVECNSFNARDHMARYVRWYRKGYMASNGRCFDIGNTVRNALHIFEASGKVFAGSTDPQSAGNGSLMRLAPVPLAYRLEPARAIEYAGLSSRTTHGTTIAVDACRYFAALIVGALNCATKEELLSETYSPVTDHWKTHPLCPEIEAVARGSFKTKQPPEIKGSGYVVQALEAALWAFHNSDNFKDGCLLAVNLGDDADTTAAIFGQLAGAFYGVGAIPSDWAARIARRDLIITTANQLFQLASTMPQTTAGNLTATRFAAAVDEIQSKWKSDSTQMVLATEAIDALPVAVAIAKLHGASHAVAITFDQTSYTRPAGRAGIHAGECKPEWLKTDSAAKAVFDYCEMVGLNPRISHNSGSNRLSYTFAICATW